MRISLLLSLVLLFGSLAAAHAGQQDFTLTNKSGRDICDVYISPDNAKDWQEDLLESDKTCLHHGESVKIVFDRSLKGVRIWDMLVVDNKGNETVYENFDLMKISTIEIRPNSIAEYW